MCVIKLGGVSKLGCMIALVQRAKIYRCPWRELGFCKLSWCIAAFETTIALYSSFRIKSVFQQRNCRETGGSVGFVTVSVLCTDWWEQPVSLRSLLQYKLGKDESLNAFLFFTCARTSLWKELLQKVLMLLMWLDSGAESNAVPLCQSLTISL